MPLPIFSYSNSILTGFVCGLIIAFQIIITEDFQFFTLLLFVLKFMRLIMCLVTIYLFFASGKELNE